MCNICGWEGDALASDEWHPYTECPSCRSQVRQRLFWALVHHGRRFEFDALFVGKRVLHFAPEEAIGRRLRSVCAQYQTADGLASGYRYAAIDLALDISRMPEVASQSLDCVIAFDVLEHVPDHLGALAELYRVLAPGGCCILAVPQKDDAPTTLEDPSVTDPAERRRRYGQEDHVRIYGHDFPQLVASAGFRVTTLAEDVLDPELVRRHVLAPPISSAHPLATNHRKIFFGEKPRVEERT